MGETGFLREGERSDAEWAHLGSNQGPLACEASALPLSYAPGRAKLSGPFACG